jgi:hypothetical protein
MRAYSHGVASEVKVNQDTRRRLGTAVALALLGCGACGRRAAVPPVPPVATAPGVIVTLAWTAPVDLDLYVTGPGGETVYFASPQTPSGGVLERDARCADRGQPPHAEQVRWTRPPAGRYRVGVDFIEACAGGGSEAPYRLVIDVDGHRTEGRGRARLGVREPRAAEFAVTR